MKEELVILYKSKPDDQILETLFSQLKMLTYRVSSKYWGLNEEDILSFAYETLYLCLKSYHIDGGAKFTSYYATSLKFKLRAETISTNQQKRKANHLCESYEALKESGFDIALQPEQDILLIEAINKIDLTEAERRYCLLLIDGRYTNHEIAGKMEVSVMTLSNMRKKLKIKLKEVFINQ